MDVHGPHPDDNRDKSSRIVAATVEELRQTQCTSTRSKAIVTFCKGLRRGPRFQQFWDSVGGAAGLAELLAEFSLRDVRAICRRLGATASAQNARPERHAGLAELVRLLHEDGPVQRDPRPLRRYYRDIVPACDLGFVEEWDDGGRADWTKFQRTCLLGSHREWYQKRFLRDLCLPVGAAQLPSFSVESRLFRGDLRFSETILSTLIADKEPGSHIPRDFLCRFVRPVLQRLVRRRKYDDEARDGFLSLVVRCLEVHAKEFESHPIVDRERLLRYTVQRWSVARVRGVRAATAPTKEQTERCLERLVELMHSSRKLLGSLRKIFDELLLGRTTHVDSYQLLRLILRHARGYELELDDDSPSTLSRLNNIAAGDLWPMKLFLYLDVEDATRLFERLSAADPTGSFLTTDRNSRASLSTVLEQKQHPGSRYGDAEIVRYLLLAKYKEKGADDPGRLARARTLIHERRKKSQEGREWQQREFWASSAINLCVAAGDMEMLDDTILWARRFNNQPLVGRGLYNASTFGTEQIRDLLSAVPGKDTDTGAAPNDRVAAVTKAIEASGRIILHLMETIKMSLSSQTPAEKKNWQTLLQLPKLVVDTRLERKSAAAFDALFEPGALGSEHLGSSAVEVVWKPTIDTLVIVEGLLPESSQLSVQATGTYVFQRLPGSSGKIRADLASFLLQRMKMHLGSEGLKQQMHKVVDLITGVAQSDQPWLATPFIRDLVLNGEGSESVWHRRLLSFRFLSSLPYKAANDLLHTLSDAIRERMREQNARPRDETGNDDRKAAAPGPPMIKVTTVKMMAQLLQESDIIGEFAACDMLLGLLAEARHIDTLVAIVSSLLSILEKPADSPEIREIHTRILDALDERLSPVLPRLNQRRPLSEADWAAVESGDAELPDLANGKPLIFMLCSHVHGLGATSSEAKSRLIELLVRVPAQSAVENARWNKLFLARNGFYLDEGEYLPAAPACLDESVRLLSQFPAYVPASTLTVLRDMALVNLDPTPGIARVTEAVKANRDLVNSNAGQHWLGQFDNPGPRTLERFGLRVVASLLQRAAGGLTASKRDDGQGLTVQLAQESVMAVADRFIACSLPDAFGRLTWYLCFERPSSRTNWLAWREHCLPMLRGMAAKIDGLRRRVSAGESVPTVLPSLFQLRVHMLPIPYSNPPKEPAPAEEMDVLVTELSSLVEWLVRRGLPYHDEFAQLKSGIRRSLDNADYTRVALRLGRLSGGAAGEEEGAQGPTLAGYLQLELAGDLVMEAGNIFDEGSGVLAEVKQMVREWVGSGDEFVRLTGMEVEKKHKAVFSK